MAVPARPARSGTSRSTRTGRSAGAATGAASTPSSGRRRCSARCADSHGALTLRDVISRALDGDPGCRRVLEDSGRHIGVAVAGVVNLLNPEVVCLGGQVARVGEIILQPMREAIERCAIPSAAASVVRGDQPAWPRRTPTCSVLWRSRTRCGRMPTGPL